MLDNLTPDNSNICGMSWLSKVSKIKVMHYMLNIGSVTKTKTCARNQSCRGCLSLIYVSLTR